MIGFLVSLLIVLIIFGLVWWILSLIPLPAPIAQVVKILCAVIFVIWMIYLLLPFVGHPLLR